MITIHRVQVRYTCLRYLVVFRNECTSNSRTDISEDIWLRNQRQGPPNLPR